MSNISGLAFGCSLAASTYQVKTAYELAEGKNAYSNLIVDLSKDEKGISLTERELQEAGNYSSFVNKCALSELEPLILLYNSQINQYVLQNHFSIGLAHTNLWSVAGVAIPAALFALSLVVDETKHPQLFKNIGRVNLGLLAISSLISGVSSIAFIALGQYALGVPSLVVLGLYLINRNTENEMVKRVSFLATDLVGVLSVFGLIMTGALSLQILGIAPLSFNSIP